MTGSKTTRPNCTCGRALMWGDVENGGDVVEVHADDGSARCADVDAETRAAERMREVETAKAEHAALKAWQRDGENGDRPSTPTLDAMNERYVAAGCAPGSSASKRTRRTTSSTPREPKMSDNDLVRRLRELLDATPTLSQSAATSTLTGEGATIRQVRAAYKTETANRPKPEKAARASKTTTIVETVDTPLGRGKRTRTVAAPAKKSTTKKATATKKAAPAKKAPAKKSAPAKTTGKKPAAKAPAKSTAKTVTPRFKATA